MAMNKTVSFIPFQNRANGTQVWVMNPDESAIDAWVETRSFPDVQSAPALEGREKVTAGLSEWQRKKIIRYVDGNIDGKLKVSDLSEQVRLSVSRFSKGFHVTFGRPPYDYVLSRRIDAAKYLIAATEEPLSQIAHACGLCDQAHLSKVFKRIVGTTPLKWRRSATVALSAQWDFLAAGREGKTASFA
jgi:AraC-like DNA-binding protein